MRFYMRLADLLLWIAKWATIAIMATMTVSVLIGVFFRYVIPIPMAWPPEAARFMMVAVTMVASSVAIRQLEHVGITFVVDTLPNTVRLALYLFGTVATTLFLVLFVVFSARMTVEMGSRQTSPALGLPMAAAFIAMPIGGVMMLVQLGAATIEGVVRARGGGSPYAPDAGQHSV